MFTNSYPVDINPVLNLELHFPFLASSTVVEQVL
jgi:hypothetical protein